MGALLARARKRSQRWDAGCRARGAGVEEHSPRLRCSLFEAAPRIAGRRGDLSRGERAWACEPELISASRLELAHCRAGW